MTYWKNETLRKDSQAYHGAATRFVKWANDKLEETEEEFVLEAAISVRRQRQRKCMPGGICKDEAVSAASSTKKYEIEVYNSVMHSIVNMKRRSTDILSW